MPKLTRRPQILLLAVLVVTVGLTVSLVSLPAHAIPTGCGDLVVICGSWAKAGCCPSDPTWQYWTRRCWLCPQNCTPCSDWWDEYKCEGGC